MSFRNIHCGLNEVIPLFVCSAEFRLSAPMHAKRTKAELSVARGIAIALSPNNPYPWLLNYHVCVAYMGLSSQSVSSPVLRVTFKSIMR